MHVRPTGTVCSSCGEAIESLDTSCSTYDVVLAEVRAARCACMQVDLPASSHRTTIHTPAQAKMLVEGDEAVTLRERMAHLPLVLMSEDNNEHRVLSGIKLGACDFLDKPLSSLKLKNIWQHVVRKMMEHHDEDHDECLALDEACFRAASLKGMHSKSEASLQAPKTPSPVTSNADLFSMVTSHHSKVSADTAGESATSEATREETSKRVLRSARRRSTGSVPVGYQPPMVMVPHGMIPTPSGMVMVPQPTKCYYPAPMSSSASMPCMGFMPTPVLSTSPADILPEGLFAPTATYLPPAEPDLTISVDKAGPIGLTLRKSASLLSLLNEPAK